MWAQKKSFNKIYTRVVQVQRASILCIYTQTEWNAFICDIRFEIFVIQDFILQGTSEKGIIGIHMKLLYRIY